MVSSLDKLNNKLSLMDLDKKKEVKNTDQPSKAQQQQLVISQKVFKEEKTNEILIVNKDGCYTYQPSANGELIVLKLNDVKEILDTGYEKLITQDHNASMDKTSPEFNILPVVN